MNIATLSKGVLVSASFVMIFYVSLSPRLPDDTHTIDEAGVPYGSSVFTRYGGDIYAAVPSNGYYKIDSADTKSFAPLGENRYGLEIAKDNNNVYCGNRVLPKLDPKTVSVLGNGYLGNGDLTYYCSMRTIRNPDLSPWLEVYQEVLYDFKQGPKPQSYIYPFVELPKSSTPYRPLLDIDFATNGAQVYYRGLPLPLSKPGNFRKIYTMAGNNSTDISEDFFADGQHVYFHDELLPLSDDPSLYGFYFGSWNLPFLFDPRIGMVYLRTQAFDESNAPYQLITNKDGHGHHALFSSKGGLFYFDTETDRVEQARGNPFSSGEFIPLSPYVFHHDQQILYLETSENWGGNKSPGLNSRSTHIYQLANVTDKKWQHIGDVSYNFGAVWKNGDSFYYFDELGDSQLVKNAIYAIADIQTVKLLIADPLVNRLGANKIRNLIREKKLIVPEHIELLQIKTKYSFF